MTESACGRLSLPQQKKLREARQTRIRGQVESSFSGGVELKSAKIFFKGAWWPFAGKIILGERMNLVVPENRQVEVSGHFECDTPAKNFSGFEDRFFKRTTRKLILKKGRVAWTLLPERNTLFFFLGKRFRDYLSSLMKGYPELRGIVWAVWTGETQGLNPELVSMYREGGLLPLVALSGQHVSVWIILFRLLFLLLAKIVMSAKIFRDYYRRLDLWLPLIGAAILTLTSQGAPSVLRTLAMAGAMVLLRMRKFISSPVQWVTASAALMIALEPGLLMGISFVLSVGATFLMVEISETQNVVSSVAKYFFLSTVMAVLSAPMILFYFGQWSYLSPISTICFSWMWNLLIIPVGFLIPCLGVLPDGICDSVLGFLEVGWKWLSDGQILGHYLIEKSFLAYPRPNIVETLCLQASCLILCQRIWPKKNTDNAL